MIALLKTKLVTVLCGLLLICGTLLYFSYNHTVQLNKDIATATNNYKASVRKNVVYQFTLNDLKASKDSSDLKVKELIKQLKIQPKKITETVDINSQFSKKDTVKLVDSVFVKDYTAKIGDEWYSLDLKFKAPDSFSTDLKVKNEVIAITYDKRETIKPAKKFFLWRLFQKKQTIQVIEVKELNPHSEVKDFRFIKVLK